MITHDFFFFFNDTATTEIYTLSLHDALPIFALQRPRQVLRGDLDAAEDPVVADAQDGKAERPDGALGAVDQGQRRRVDRSEEHTSELQSRQYLVCRLLLEKKKKQKNDILP